MKRVLRLALSGGLLCGLVSSCGGHSSGSAASSSTASSTTAHQSTTPNASAPTSTVGHNLTHVVLHVPPHRVLGKAAYITTMRGLGDQLARTIENLYPLVTGTANSSQRTTTLANLHSALVTTTKIEGSMLAIVPPAQVKSEHAQLAGDVKSTVQGLKSMITSLQKNDLATFETLTQFDSLRLFESTAAKLAKRGYKIT